MTSPYLQRPLRSETEAMRQINAARFRHTVSLEVEDLFTPSVLELDGMTRVTMALLAANEDTGASVAIAM